MISALPSGLRLEAEGGAVPLESPFYVERATDAQFRQAVARGDSLVLVKGPRQVGKTSLLARGLQEARQTGARVVLTDFQTLSSAHLLSAEALCCALGELLAEQLDLELLPADVWEPGRGANANFTRYLATLLEDSSVSLVWGLDEVDRLFTTSFSDEVFAMFRGWHNLRALQPDGPWRRLTLAISFATEAHLFIQDLNQSPFNVGTRVTLADFSRAELGELNRRYGSPLRTGAELDRYLSLLGGHPYLSRQGLHEMVVSGRDLDAFEAGAQRDDGPFGEHLRRMLFLLTRDHELAQTVKQALFSNGRLAPESFYRLRGAGLLAGECPEAARIRCHLYAHFLEQRLS